MIKETGLEFKKLLIRLEEKWDDFKIRQEPDYDNDYERYSSIIEVLENLTDINDMFDSLK